jgi:serine/threonine protein kinase
MLLARYGLLALQFILSSGSMPQSPSNPSDFRDSQVAMAEINHYQSSGALFRDRYRVLKVLGRGGFGVTYLATNASLPGEPKCVIKQLCPKTQNALSLERAKVRFRREARALANLGSHFQVPQLLDYFTTNGEFYLVQDYIEGETLAQEVRRRGRQSEAKVKRFLQEILPVVQFIHRNRIIHRDIKPSNIIRCGRDSRLVLIDFGAVREFLTDIDNTAYFQPQTTQFVGTPGFAPPEQLALRPCYASDVYALGMTCLYLLTGRSPIEFDVDPRTGNILWLHTVSVSGHFATVLDKMLRSAPEDRYASVDEVERALALEPHLEILSDCMNTRSRPIFDFEDDAENQYRTPIQREAQAIRKWRLKRFGRPKKNPLSIS